MAIGRDTIPIHMINTYTQFPASGGGGGGSAAITLATTSSGNYNNAVKFAFFDANANNYDYSGGIEDGSNSTLGTASGPTRTTQTIDIRAASISSAFSANAQSFVRIIVGGYIRHTGSSISSPQWVLDSSAIISQSLSNGASVGVFGQAGSTGNSSSVDATTFSNANQGIYDFSGSGSGPHLLVLGFGSGTGLPAASDSFTIRMGASATVDGSSVSAIHDIIVNIS